MRPDESARRWRWRVKEALAFAIGRTLGSRLVRGRRRGYRPLVLGYHRLVEDFDRSSQTEMASMLTSTAMFEEHLDWLGRHFRFVDLYTVGDQATRGELFDRPVAAITFDDGYRDVCELGAPILKRKGIPAAVFVVTDLIGQPYWQVHDLLYRFIAKGWGLWSNPRRQLMGVLNDLGLPASDILRGPAGRTPMSAVSTILPRLSRYEVRRVMDQLDLTVGNGFSPVPRTLTWPLIRQMREDGFIVGSHTRSHVSLPVEAPQVADAELTGSKQALQDALREPIRHFAYPGGEFTAEVVDAIA